MSKYFPKLSRLLRLTLEAAVPFFKNLRLERNKLRKEYDKLRKNNEILQKDRELLRQKSKQLYNDTKFVDNIAHGLPFPQACALHTRLKMKENKEYIARAFASSLIQEKSTSEVGYLCLAIIYYTALNHNMSWKTFSKVRYEWIESYTWIEYLDLLFYMNSDDAISNTIRWLDSKPNNPSELYALTLSLSTHKQWTLAEQVCDRLLLQQDALTEDELFHAKRIKALFTQRQKMPVSSKGKINLALQDYKTLDYNKTSSNIGYYIQTLATLSNIVRFQNVRFSSTDDGLATWVEELKNRVRPEFIINNSENNVDVALFLLDRDFPSSRLYDEPTWLFVFGPYTCPNFGYNFDFPFAKQIRPIFISFHLNSPKILTPDAVSYLKQYEPIGCRDWTTVYLLREFGVSSFFSGCVTATLGKIFTEQDKNAENKIEKKRVALVDSPINFYNSNNYISTVFKHRDKEICKRSFLTNINDAIHRLEEYQHYDSIITSRLTCYLSSKSLGLNVTFKPTIPSDARFDGLINMKDSAFDAMRCGIEEKFITVLDAIFSGESESAIREKWRKACETDVAYADFYCKNDLDLGKTTVDFQTLAANLRATALHGGLPATNEQIKVAFTSDANLSEQLPVVLESATLNSRSVLHIHIMTRGLNKEYWQRLINEFGAISSLSFYDFDSVNYGDNLKISHHLTVSTLDRLLLPEVLSTLDKIIYLDVDILVRGDLTELWAVNLGDTAIAATPDGFEGNHARYKGYNWVNIASKALHDPEKSSRLWRSLFASGPLVFPTFNAGVLVMNLAQMRRDRFIEKFLPLVETYAMNDQDALNLYTRENYVILGTEWNTLIPFYGCMEDAKIYHFIRMVKPWSDYTTIGRDEFESYRRRYLDRTSRTKTL